MQYRYKLHNRALEVISTPVISPLQKYNKASCQAETGTEASKEQKKSRSVGPRPLIIRLKCLRFLQAIYNTTQVACHLCKLLNGSCRF